MLKKPITYVNLDGMPVTEDFYFNLSKVEIAELELSKVGGLSAHLQAIVDSKDGGQILAAFKDLLGRAYGVRSVDGRRFIKSEEVWLEFTQTPAYDQLFMELVTDAKASAEFINAIIPPDMVKTMSPGKAVGMLMDENVAHEPPPVPYTDEELLAMTDEQFAAIAGTDPKRMPKGHLLLAFQRRTSK